MVLPKKIVVDALPLCDYIPKAFTSLSRNKKGLIAASRSDGSIDIYDEKDHFYLIHHIPPWVLTSVYDICWSTSRLFAAGGDGRVFELNLTSIYPKASLILPGGLPTRSLKCGGELLVSGNDGGYINIITLANEVFELKSCLAKVEGRVLCLALEMENKHLVAASDSNGTVHVFDLYTGSTLTTFVVGDEHASTPTIVWSLIFVGGTLFSGDSRGTVSVWDVVIGGLISSFKCHNADVLSFAVSIDHQSVFAAGADPIIHRFDRCQTESISQWQPSGVIRGSQRDVRCLLFVRRGEIAGIRSCNSDLDHLIAAGNDARIQLLPCPLSNLGDKMPIPRRRLTVENFTSKSPPPIYLPFWPLSVTPNLPIGAHFAYSTFSPESGSHARLCLIQHAEYMSLYKLPRKPKRLFQPKDSKRCIIKLAKILPKRGNHITTCCISPCGKFIAYSDNVRLRILKIVHPANWRFNLEKPCPLVSISRLNWSDANPKNSRSRTSSTSSDADNTEIGESPSRFLYLDQSSADLFMNYGAENDENIDEHLVNKKRRVTTPVPGDNKSVEVDQDDDASALPPSSLMAFTPSSLSLVCVDASSQQIICRALDTGSEIWRFAFPATSGGEITGPIHLLKMAKLGDGPMTLLVVAFLDERVSVYAFMDETSSVQQPHHLFTCPRSANPTHPRHHSRSLAIALCVGQPKVIEEDEKKNKVMEDAIDVVEVKARVAILHTTGQLTEWTLRLRLTDSTVQLASSPLTDNWLDEFWQRHGATWQRYLPRFHSLDYFFSSRILMLASRGFCLTLDRRKPIKPNDIQIALRERNRKATDGCLRVFGQLKNMLYCAVLPDRIAAFQMDLLAAVENLPPPLKRKRFGT